MVSSFQMGRAEPAPLSLTVRREGLRGFIERAGNTFAAIGDLDAGYRLLAAMAADRGHQDGTVRIPLRKGLPAAVLQKQVHDETVLVLELRHILLDNAEVQHPIHHGITGKQVRVGELLLPLRFLCIRFNFYVFASRRNKLIIILGIARFHFNGIFAGLVVECLEKEMELYMKR